MTYSKNSVLIKLSAINSKKLEEIALAYNGVLKKEKILTYSCKMFLQHYYIFDDGDILKCFLKQIADEFGRDITIIKTKMD